MSPTSARWGEAPKKDRRILEKMRWPVILVVAAGVIAFQVVSRRNREIAKPGELEGYQHDVAMLEREYGKFHGRLLREPELESQFRHAADFARQGNYPAAIEILEKVSKDAAVPVVFTNLGSLYAAMNDRSRSIGAFREALARDTEYKPVRDTIERLRLFSSDEANPVRQEIEPNNSDIVANLIGHGSPVTGEIAVGDTDTFKFVTPAAPRDIVKLDVENVDSTLELGIRVHDSQMKQESGRLMRPPGESLTRYIAQAPNTSLYLQIWSARNTSGQYRITLQPLKAFDALEPNDDIFTARRIDLGAAVSANIMDSDDTDYYTFQSPRTGTVEIELTNESSTLIPAITTFRSDKRNMGFGPDVRTAGANLTHRMEVMEHQSYFVQVWSQAHSSGKYGLSIR
jgi:tetratricopeptide (TPR) repeat protein